MNGSKDSVCTRDVGDDVRLNIRKVTQWRLMSHPNIVTLLKAQRHCIHPHGIRVSPELTRPKLGREET